MTTFRKIQILLLLVAIVSGVSILQERLTPHTEGIVTYYLAWDTTNATENNGVWIFDTPLDYRVQMTMGYLTSYSAELIVCPHYHNIFEWLDNLLLGSAVLANHGTVADETQVTYGVVESLMIPQNLTWGTAIVSETRYCQGHYAVGGAKQTTQNMPDDVMMNRLSVYIEGTYQQAEQVETPFVIEAIFGDGTLQNLVSGTATYGEVLDGKMDIIITRHLGSLFDTVDFANMNERERAIALLRQLSTQTIIGVD